MIAWIVDSEQVFYNHMNMSGLHDLLSRGKGWDRPRISAVIPTWNEESWLPALIDRLRSVAQISEVIIADNISQDRTASIALAQGCTVVAGGNPAEGRNAGAEVAVEDLLLFTDADVVVTPEVVAAILSEFDDPHTNLVHFRLSPVSRKRVVVFCYKIADLYVRLCRSLGRGQGSAPLIGVRRSAFLELQGFDTGMKAGEDVDLIRRAARRIGGVCYVRHPVLRVSARRFDIERCIPYIYKCALWAICRFLGIRRSVHGYKWQPYPSRVAELDPVANAVVNERQQLR